MRTLPASFAALAEPRFRLLLASTFLGTSGIWTANVVRGYLVFDLTGSSTALAATFVAIGITMVGFSPFGGALADRYSPRHVLMLSSALFVAVSVGSAVLVLSGVVAFWMILLLALAEGAGNALAAPSRQALLGQVVAGGQGLGNASAVQQVAFNSSKVVLPTVAGALIAIATVGVAGTYLLGAAFFALGFASAFAVSGIRARGLRRQTSMRRDVGDGLRYLRARPALLILVAGSLGISLTVFPSFIFLPALVDEVFQGDAFDLGLITTAGALGGFALSVVIAMIADRPSAWTAFFVIDAVFCVSILGLALAPNFAVAVPIVVVVGACEAGFAALGQSLVFKWADPAYHGRLQAIMIMTLGLTGFAALPMGAVGDWVGERTMLVAMAAAGTLALTAVALASRRLDARADSAPIGPPATTLAASPDRVA